MVIIRAINTIDAMTASIEKVDWDVLEKITNRILAEVENVNRVCYDMSPKPPATIENQKIQFKNIDKEGEIEIIVTGEKKGAVGYAIYRMIDGEMVDLFGEGMEDCC